VELPTTNSYIKIYILLHHFTVVDDSILARNGRTGKRSLKGCLRPYTGSEAKDLQQAGARQGRDCSWCRVHGTSNTFFFAISIQMPKALMNIQSMECF
jgi:hypothetical protein